MLCVLLYSSVSGSSELAGVALLAWLLQQRGARHRTFALLEAIESLRQGVAGLPELHQQVSWQHVWELCAASALPGSI